ncbi:MAG: TetR/AcrR family transcriptional regulator [Micropepsaceae bacterium]
MSVAHETVDKTYHHGDLKAALLSAAREIVEEQGPEAFTLREAARRAGVSHGAPAHHFGDKTGLLTELAIEVMGERVGLVEEAKIGAGPEPMDQLKACGLAHIAFHIRHPKLEDLCWRDNLVNKDDPRLLAVINRMTGGLIETMSAVLGKTLHPDKEGNPSTLLAVSVVTGYAQMVNDGMILKGVPEPERTQRAMQLAAQMLDLVGAVFGPAFKDLG